MHRSSRRAFAPAVVSLLALLANAADASVVSFGWSGSVKSITPAFAAALPPGSGLVVGAPAYVRYDFESTTVDQNAATSTGNFAGALRSFTLQTSSFAFTQHTGGPVNTINVFEDPLFGFYEPVTTVDPSSPLATFPSLRGEVLFIPTTPSQIPSDALLLTIPDPTQWATASSAILDPNGSVVLELDLGAVCTGSCQPRWPQAVPTLALDGRAVLVGMLLATAWLASQPATRSIR